MNSVHPQRRAGGDQARTEPGAFDQDEGREQQEPGDPERRPRRRRAGRPVLPRRGHGTARRADFRTPGRRGTARAPSGSRRPPRRAAKSRLAPTATDATHGPRIVARPVSRRAVVLISTPHENSDVDGPRAASPSCWRPSAGAQPKPAPDSRGRARPAAPAAAPAARLRRARNGAGRGRPSARRRARGRARRPAALRPNPPPELDTFKGFLGKWKCEGKAFATPMFGPQHAVKGNAEAKLESDNFWQSFSYEEKKTKEHQGLKVKGPVGLRSGHRSVSFASGPVTTASGTRRARRDGKGTSWSGRARFRARWDACPFTTRSRKKGEKAREWHTSAGAHPGRQVDADGGHVTCKK